jgi:hypothetical protein
VAHLTQRQAAQQWSIPWTTFRRAVKAGKVSISADKTVDTSEMLRAFGEPAAQGVTGTTGPSGTSVAQPVAHPPDPRDVELARLQLELDWAHRLLEERGRRLETLERLLLAPPPGSARPPGFWRRLFGA